MFQNFRVQETTSQSFPQTVTSTYVSAPGGMGEVGDIEQICVPSRIKGHGIST